jgi:short subunit dehydrogenase-like uncharacterized protein
MIALVGATGYTGKLVASQLLGLKVPFFIAGRNEQALNALSQNLGGVEYRIVDVRNQATFNALDGCRIVINCAGPFTDFGEPVVQAAIARGAHYLDTTGEQGFIKLVYDKYHEQAKAKKIVLVPACAYEYAIGDAMGAQLCRDFAECRAIDLIYSMGEMHTSPGTRKSIVRAVSDPGFLYKNGKFIQVSPAAIVGKTQIVGRSLSIMSFPAGEVLMLPRHTRVQDVTTYMTAEAPLVVLRIMAVLGRMLMKGVGDFLVNRISAAVPSLEQRQNSTFVIEARTTIGTTTPTITVTGNDPYLLTAIIIGDAAAGLLANEPAAFGAVTPAMVSGGDRIRTLLERAGVKWVVDY